MKSSTIGVDKPIGRDGARPLLKKYAPLQVRKLHKIILAQVAWCTMPALIFVRMGQLRAGSIWCFSFLLIFLFIYALKRNIPAFLALTVASLPALSYTRGFFFHNSVVFLFGIGIIFWLIHAPKEGLKLWENHLIRWFFLIGMVYWMFAVLITRQYHANLNVMEMLCSAGSIFLLTRYPRYLATGIAGVGISIVSVAVGMMGLGARMGMANIEGINLGNPIVFGLSVVLVLLLIIADNGKWLFLENSKKIKNGLIVMCGILLLLSTSRGSMLVVFVGVIVTVFYQSQQRRKVLLALLLMGGVFLGVLQTERGEQASLWFEKVFDSEQDLSQKTTGRYEMWLLFPEILEDYPLWGVGPGLGKEAYAHYSLIYPEVTYHKGDEMAWHSLYLQVGVETGMIGLGMLAILLIKLTFKTLSYRKWTGQVVPLIGIVGFVTIGVSVSGFDGISGLFLGFAFSGTILPKRKLV